MLQQAAAPAARLAVTSVTEPSVASATVVNFFPPLSFWRCSSYSVSLRWLSGIWVLGEGCGVGWGVSHVVIIAWHVWDNKRHLCGSVYSISRHWNPTRVALSAAVALFEIRKVRRLTKLDRTVLRLFKETYRR